MVRVFCSSGGMSGFSKVQTLFCSQKTLCGCIGGASLVSAGVLERMTTYGILSKVQKKDVL